MNDDMHLVQVMRFCCHCHCGCVELFVEPEAPDERRVVMTDDFGQRIQMSLDQLRTIVNRAKSGAVDEALLACSS
jgi:hypothetical protein